MDSNGGDVGGDCEVGAGGGEGTGEAGEGEGEQGQHPEVGGASEIGESSS